jgi:hypothetical protein
MYTSQNFQIRDEETFSLCIPTDRDYKILQLTDLHLGFGMFSQKKDRLALAAVTELIRRTGPDLIVLTGDSVFPFFPKSGTMNNRKQAQKLLAFLDGFQIPYTFVFGNHDCEMGAVCNKEQLAEIFATGKYAVFTKGRYEHSPQNPIAGVGNFVLDLIDGEGKILLPLIHLDSNMYGDGWFFSGFDCIHEDQADWCMQKLNERKVPAMAFFHMPPAEFKKAYEKMKLGDHSVIYEHGSIGEKNEYFGISNRPPHFFEKAVDNGWLKWIFCGHDHLNTLSLTYKGIRMTYGMSRTEYSASAVSITNHSRTNRGSLSSGSPYSCRNNCCQRYHSDVYVPVCLTCDQRGSPLDILLCDAEISQIINGHSVSHADTFIGQ